MHDDAAPAHDAAPGPPTPLDGSWVTAHRDRIEVDVPLRSELLSTVRTVTATLAADAGFTIDEIDDIRLALAETLTAYLQREEGQREEGGREDGAREEDGRDEGPGGDRARVTYVVAGSTLAVNVRPKQGPARVEFDELASGILAAVVDDCVTDDAGVTVVKRATEAIAADASR